MRIAHIVSTFTPQIGGMGSICAQEALSLAKQGHEVTVFTLDYSTNADYKDHDEQFPFKIVRLKALVKIGDAGLVPQILRQLKDGFDLLHLHYPFYGGAEWLYFSPIPLVVTYHMDAQTTGLKSFVQKVYDAIWPRVLFAKAKKIMLVDPGFRGSKYLETMAKDKILDIANGVDLQVFKPQSPNFEGLELAEIKNKKIVLFVGNILPVKRLDLLIRAIKSLNDPNVALLVVGGGYELHRCQQLARDLLVEDRVFFVGPCQDQQKLVEYYNIADCVAVPSDYESFSLVAIEAMACGVPVVASDLPVFRNKLSQAVLFTPGSAEGLVQALQKVLQMPIADRQLGIDKGRQEVELHYNWQNHITKLLDIYTEVINRNTMSEFDYEKSIWGHGQASTKITSPTSFRLRQSLKALAGLPVGAKVLELGAGAGQFIRAVKKNKPELDCYGSDISQQAINAARQADDGVQYDLSEEKTSPYPDNYFDAVLIYDVLEHVTDPRSIVTEVYRILKPGGRFYAFVPCEGDALSLWNLLRKFNIGADLTKKYAGHINRFSRKELLQLVMSVGFSCKQVRYSEHLLGQLLGIVAFFSMDRFAKRQNVVQVNNEQFFGELSKKGGGILQVIKDIINSLVALESIIFSRLPSSNVHLTVIKK